MPSRYNGSNIAGLVVATTSYRPEFGGGSGYDGMGRVTALTQTFGPNTHPYTYQYDAASNIVYEASPDGYATYSLDNASQLTAANVSTLPLRKTMPTTRTATRPAPALIGADNRSCQTALTPTNTTRMEISSSGRISPTSP